MTAKQKQIVQHALALFANEGYSATSTSKIAKAANVSEGLIFRHFGNKQGLLAAIMQLAEEQLSSLLINIISEDDPKEVIRKSIALPFDVKKSDYPFWRLQFKLKWDTNYNNPEKLQPLIKKMASAFAALNYAEPNMEAVKLSAIIESVSIQLLRDELKNKIAFKNYLLKNYKL